MRLALLILPGLAAGWVKVYLPADNHPNVPHLVNKVTFVCSFAATVIAAGQLLDIGIPRQIRQPTI